MAAMHLGAQKIFPRRNPFGSNDSRWVQGDPKAMYKDYNLVITSTLYFLILGFLILNYRVVRQDSTWEMQLIIRYAPGIILLIQSVDALAADVQNLRDQITHSNNISSGLQGAVLEMNWGEPNIRITSANLK